MKRKVKHFRRKRRNYTYNKAKFRKVIERAFKNLALALDITPGTLKEQWHEQTNCK